MDKRDKAFLLKEGLRLLDAKEPVQAISAFQDVIRLDPQSDGAYSGIGQAFLDMDEFEGAQAALSKSLDLNPTSPRYVLLGYALQQLGRKRLAFRAYKNALRLHPSNEEAYVNAGKLLASTHPRFAAALFRKGIEADPNYLLNYLELGIVLNQIGRFQDAKEYLEKAFSREPNDFWVAIELSNSLWRLGERSSAEDLLRATAKKFPNETVPLWTLAAYLENAGRTDDAEILFRDAVARDPVNHTAKKFLARFLKRKFQKEES